MGLLKFADLYTHGRLPVKIFVLMMKKTCRLGYRILIVNVLGEL